MAGERMRRLWSLFGWQVEEIESWLEDMAAKGWHLSHNGLIFAVFTMGEPRRDRYRCFYFTIRDSHSEQISLFSDAGWEHVFSCGNAHIFRALEGIPETAPENTHSSKLLQRVLCAVPLLLGALSGAFLLTLVLRWSELLGQALAGLTIPCIILAVFFSLWLTVSSICVLHRIRSGALLRNRPFRIARLVNKAGAFVILILFISIIAGYFTVP